MGQETQIPDHEDRVAAGQCPSLANRSLNYSTYGSETASCLERKENEIPETQSTKVNPKCFKNLELSYELLSSGDREVLDVGFASK